MLKMLMLMKFMDLPFFLKLIERCFYLKSVLLKIKIRALTHPTLEL